MLDHFKLFQELERVRKQIFVTSDQDLDHARLLWKRVCDDITISQKIKTKKWSLLIPFWQEKLDQFEPISCHSHPYQVLAVDGSQIYYDKHQGPPCSLINIGSVFLQYGAQKSRVELYSSPEVIVEKHNQVDFVGAEYINFYREQSELEEAVKKSAYYLKQSSDPFMCMLDGSLIFFQLDGASKDSLDNFFANYIQQLQLFFEYKILHVAYMSFAKTKDLINILRLYAADFQEKNLDTSDYLAKLCDMDLLKMVLPHANRTILFESKAPICYAYPKHLKPYFCYLNVGVEIVRLEFPEWIAHDLNLVDKLCSMTLDQVKKGYGYPVVLFEAHEQAVVKSSDRDFFYETIKQMYVKNNKNYQISAKSIKKIKPTF